MPILNSPFALPYSVTSAGRGEVVVAVLPPAIPSIPTLSFKYPLKLITRIPKCALDSKYPSSASTPVHLYLLTYGGGLLPGDHIDVSITLNPRSRLVLTTPQGSTKIFKSELNDVVREKNNSIGSWVSKQTLNVQLSSEAGLCYLPDPSVPFENSRYEQVQLFTIIRGEGGNDPGGKARKAESARRPGASLCVLDWVTQGRSARGEDWSFHLWKGRNEVWVEDFQSEKKRLLLRDSVILDDSCNDNDIDGANLRQETQPHSHHNRFPSLNTRTSIADRTHPHGILGTFIIYGPLFESLASFFMEKFTSQPRIGGRNWSSSSSSNTFYPDGKVNKSYDDRNNDGRINNIKHVEKYQSNVTWTAARVRNGFVLVKFGAEDFESAKEWLGHMLRTEGSIEREFGEESLGCL